MTLKEALINDEFNIALNIHDFPKAFSFLDKSEEREKLFLALQEEGYNPLFGFTKLPNNFLIYGRNIKYITIPDLVTSISARALESCSSLTSVEIGDAVTSIGSYAFQGCSSLIAVYITDIESWCNISFGGTTANPLYYAKDLYLNNELVTKLVIPDTVTEIKPYAFCGCDSLMSVAIGDSVTSIGKYAFHNCYSLTSVVIGDSVTAIDSYAFNSCDSLTSVEIPDGVITIGEAAFYNCSSLTNIIFKGTIAQWKRINKHYDWDYKSSIEKIICIDGVIEL